MWRFHTLPLHLFLCVDFGASVCKLILFFSSIENTKMSINVSLSIYQYWTLDFLLDLQLQEMNESQLHNHAVHTEWIYVCDGGR